MWIPAIPTNVAMIIMIMITTNDDIVILVNLLFLLMTVRIPVLQLARSHVPVWNDPSLQALEHYP